MSNMGMRLFILELLDLMEYVVEDTYIKKTVMKYSKNSS